MAYLNLAHMPDPKTEYTATLHNLNGGLNLSELDYAIANNESPDMLNLMWRDGTLSSRDGQVWVTDDTSLGAGHAVYQGLFWEHLFAHIGTSLCCIDPRSEEPEYEVLYSGVPETRGTFFHYADQLYYKTAGAYIEITYNAEAQSFTAEAVEGYTPNTILNASPLTGSGDLYQPENRIQSKKLVKYTAQEGVTEYHLPVTLASAEDVVEVKVDGQTKTAGADYTVDPTSGVITFSEAPPVANPPAPNTVWITYSKDNDAAYNSIMGCPYAATYGGTGELCIVMGGCEAQPNAFFWNGNNVNIDASYFPMDQYQLAGDTDDAVTGFGKQQSYLVVFKMNSVGRTIMKTETVNGRLTIDLPYTPINDKIGCDLPWTIQLIDNNLVWCNTDQGAHLLKDSSSAYENNIICVSKKVNAPDRSDGFLQALRRAETVCSVDDSRRYWVCTGSTTWVWDYETSEYRNASWYPLDSIRAVDFCTDLSDLWHLDKLGRLTHMVRCFADYDGPIEKRYQFATQLLGGYDRVKNVNSVIIVIRSDTNSVTKLTYISDYEERRDLTDLTSRLWRVFPMDLSAMSLKGRGFGTSFRRRPMCRRIRHFTMRLENNETGQDLSIVAAQIFYNYQGRQR